MASRDNEIKEHLSSIIEVDSNIIKVACNIYYEKLRHITKLKKLSLGYLAFTEAHRKMGIPIDDDVVQKHFPLSKEQIKKAIKGASREGYDLIIHRYCPKDFVCEFTRLLGIHNDHLDIIYSICNKVMKHNSNNYEVKPQNIAAAVVLYYAGIKGYAINIEEFSKRTKVARSSMELLKKEVIQSDN
jgi:hypothetical protein